MHKTLYNISREGQVPPLPMPAGAHEPIVINLRLVVIFEPQHIKTKEVVCRLCGLKLCYI